MFWPALRDGGILKITPKRKVNDGRKILIVDKPALSARLKKLAADGPNRFPGIDRFVSARIVAKVGKASDLDQPLYPHLLRHTYVTELSWTGVGFETVRELVGQSSIETT